MFNFELPFGAPNNTANKRKHHLIYIIRMMVGPVHYTFEILFESFDFTNLYCHLYLLFIAI